MKSYNEDTKWCFDASLGSKGLNMASGEAGTCFRSATVESFERSPRRKSF